MSQHQRMTRGGQTGLGILESQFRELSWEVPKEVENVLELVSVSLKAASPRFPALNKMNTNLMIGDKYNGTNGQLSALGSWFSDLSKHQNHLEDCLKQLSRPHSQRFSFGSPGMGPENLHF